MPFPTVEKILKAEPEVRLYALNGLAHTFASTIEQSMFWCYAAAAELTWENAADEFFRHVRIGHKRPLADAAVQAKLAGTPDEARWADLNRRIRKLIDQDDSPRNLVSHNPVAVSMYVQGMNIHMRAEVAQTSLQVARGRRKPQKVGVPEMAQYCEELMQLSLDLETFLEEVLKYPRSHPERCDHW